MTEEREPTQPERRETAAERSDRNWSELLQEVRVTQTGIQILSGFLLTVPFQARFTSLSPAMLGVFLGAVGFAALATLLVVAPVSLHRILFRRHVKEAGPSARAGGRTGVRSDGRCRPRTASGEPRGGRRDRVPERTEGGRCPVLVATTRPQIEPANVRERLGDGDEADGVGAAVQ